jgi:hypothetical protein
MADFGKLETEAQVEKLKAVSFNGISCSLNDYKTLHSQEETLAERFLKLCLR